MSGNEINPATRLSPRIAQEKDPTTKQVGRKPFTDADKIELIAAVKEYPFLYNTKNAWFDENRKRQMAWREIAMMLEHNAETCEEVWRSMVNSFKKYRQRKKDGQTPRSWKFDDDMNFFTPYINIRTRPSGICCAKIPQTSKRNTSTSNVDVSESIIDNAESINDNAESITDKAESKDGDGKCKSRRAKTKDGEAKSKDGEAKPKDKEANKDGEVESQNGKAMSKYGEGNSKDGEPNPKAGFQQNIVTPEEVKENVDQAIETVLVDVITSFPEEESKFKDGENLKKQQVISLMPQSEAILLEVETLNGVNPFSPAIACDAPEFLIDSLPEEEENLNIDNEDYKATLVQYKSIPETPIHSTTKALIHPITEASIHLAAITDSTIHGTNIPEERDDEPEGTPEYPIDNLPEPLEHITENIVDNLIDEALGKPLVFKSKDLVTVNDTIDGANVQEIKEDAKEEEHVRYQSVGNVFGKSMVDDVTSFPADEALSKDGKQRNLGNCNNQGNSVAETSIASIAVFEDPTIDGRHGPKEEVQGVNEQEGHKPDNDEPGKNEPEYDKAEGDVSEYDKPEGVKSEYDKPEGVKSEYDKPEGVQSKYDKPEGVKSEFNAPKDYRKGDENTDLSTRVNQTVMVNAEVPRTHDQSTMTEFECMDQIDIFFSGIAARVKQFSTLKKTMAKAKVFKLISEIELAEIEETENGT